MQGISTKDFEFKCRGDISITEGCYAEDWDCTATNTWARITHYRYKIFNQNKETKKVIKFIDQEEQDEVIEAFAYTTMDGRVEKVVGDGSCIEIIESIWDNKLTIWKKDIPKLIKALEAAHREWGE